MDTMANRQAKASSEALTGKSDSHALVEEIKPYIPSESTKKHYYANMVLNKGVAHGAILFEDGRMVTIAFDNDGSCPFCETLKGNTKYIHGK